MKFSEFAVGQVLKAGPYVLDEKAIVAFARDWDPQWFHADVEAARTGPWEGLIASGWQTCGVAMKLVVEHFLADSESFGSPGLAYLKWPAPVRAGDALHLRADVIDVRRSEKKPELGILRWRWRLLNQFDSEVLDLEVTSLFKLAAKD